MSDWTEPKANKIARQRETVFRRGPRKGRPRRKGIKARLDEILSAWAHYDRYNEWAEREAGRTYKPGQWQPHWRETAERYNQLAQRLIKQLEKDGFKYDGRTK